MDLSNPLRSVAPTVEADVLAVLAHTHAPLTGLRIQELAGRSYARVRLVLRRLVEHGLVLVERHGNTNSYVLNRDHILAGPVEAMVDASSTLESEIRSVVDHNHLRPAAVVLFGSFARRSGDADSDIDILLVRPDDIDGDAPSWVAQRGLLADTVERRSGNRAQIVELSTTELDEAVAHNEPLIDSLRADGVVVAGAAPALARPVGGAASRW